MPSNEGRTLDSRVTFSGSFPSSFLAVSFSNSTSRSGLEANCARCRNGARQRGEGLVDTLGRHVVVVGVDVRVLEVVREAIEAGFLTRPRVKAARSGLEVRSIMTGVFWFESDRWSLVNPQIWFARKRLESVCSQKADRTWSTYGLGISPLYQSVEAEKFPDDRPFSDQGVHVFIILKCPKLEVAA